MFASVLVEDMQMKKSLFCLTFTWYTLIRLKSSSQLGSYKENESRFLVVAEKDGIRSVNLLLSQPLSRHKWTFLKRNTDNWTLLMSTRWRGRTDSLLLNNSAWRLKSQCFSLRSIKVRPKYFIRSFSLKVFSITVVFRQDVFSYNLLNIQWQLSNSPLCKYSTPPILQSLCQAWSGTCHFCVPIFDAWWFRMIFSATDLNDRTRCFS